MIIAFWSPFHGQAGVSTNMLLIANTYAIKEAAKCLVLQPQYIEEGHGEVMNSIITDEGAGYGTDTGIDALLMSLKTSHNKGEILENCITNVLENRLDILKGTVCSSRNVYENDINSEIITTIPNLAGKYYEYVFTDTDAGESGLTRKIMQKADITVVNIRQNIEMLEYALAADIPGKVFYLFSHYSRESRYNLRNLRRFYRKLTNDNSEGIPYSSRLGDAVSAGNITSFIMRNINADKDYGEYELMQGVINTAVKIKSMLCIQQ